MSQHSAWCRNFFDRMNDKGVWGIPRTGLLFQKDARSESLTWVGLAPPTEVFPLPLDKIRNAEFEIVKREFGAAGVSVYQAENIKHYDSHEAAIAVLVPKQIKD